MNHTYQTPGDLADIDINSPFYRPSSPIFCDESYCYKNTLGEPCICYSQEKFNLLIKELHELISTEIFILYEKKNITEFEYKVAQKRNKLKFINSYN
tara:strand:- start:830 stop:1120 length:291 start_codon:yes stop_codon:yes gene_type:complete